MLVFTEKQKVTIFWKGREKGRNNWGFEVQEHLHWHRAGRRALQGELAGCPEERDHHE